LTDKFCHCKNSLCSSHFTASEGRT